jgi:trk system potassium uptake protein TrkH
LVLAVVGQLLMPFSATFVAPAALALVDGRVDSAIHFAIAGLASVITGLVLSSPTKDITFRREEGLAVVALTWVFVALAGAVPYVLYGLSVVDALFESMSGFTTTGATILSDFSPYDRAFFLWRAMTQWFGGLGVIALFIVVLPRLGIAGRQLFFAEASGAPSEAVRPQIRHAAKRLWVLYATLTVLLAGLLVAVSGFSWYEGLTHALTTLAAGGFSPNAESIAGYHSVSAEWLITLFMILAGTSFTLQHKVLTERPTSLLRDGEFLFYFGVLVSVALGIAATLPSTLSLGEGLRAGFFQSASLISSTGFASTDYNLWPDAARSLLIVAMLIGGCAGSAAGGPKAIRILLVLKHVWREIILTPHPRAVVAIRYKGLPVSRDIMRAVFTLVVLFMVGHFVIGTILVLLGSDLVLGYSAALACLGNIGPAFGAAGPMGSFAGFSGASKVVLTIAMWLGRLEIVTILALLHADVLRGMTFKR